MHLERFRIIGAGRRELSDQDFRRLAKDSIGESGEQPDGESWDRFAASLRFAGIGEGPEKLRRVVERSRSELDGDPGLLHHLSVPPSAAAGIVTALGEVGLADGARIIMEKPFGTDLASARHLNAAVLSVFDESQVFRIDHYLGREAVQNLLAIRFANGMFEAVWNRDHIDHVQIDVPETLSIGMRAGFYEGTGAFRDMIVTHLFQVLGFVAMEPPTALTPKVLMAERAKVFDSMRDLDAERRRPRSVPRLPRRGGRRAGLRHRDLRRGSRLRRQLALGGRPVLPADRQAPRPERPSADDRVQRAAAAHVPARLPSRGGVVRLRPSDLRARRSRPASPPASSPRSRARR